jgi:hypothetical protein
VNAVYEITIMHNGNYFTSTVLHRGDDDRARWSSFKKYDRLVSEFWGKTIYINFKITESLNLDLTKHRMEETIFFN